MSLARQLHTRIRGFQSRYLVCTRSVAIISGSSATSILNGLVDRV
jgi:hypothetical protein